jgi:hypothetical protein
MKSLPLIVLLLLTQSALARETPQPLRQGDTITLNNRPCTLTKLDTLPCVETDYTLRFRFDRFDNPKLTQLREKYHLDQVVAPGKDEFDRQVLLLDWVYNQFKKFGRPSSPARGALDILDAANAGHTFFCAHYADTFVSAAASLGWIDRPLALRRPDNIGQGSTEHSSTEIWSNQYRKWIMFDPTFAMYVEKNGVPLSAYELRQAWFYTDGKDLAFVIGKERKRHTKSDIPIFRHRFEGFGDLVVDGGCLNVYAFIGYIPNTDLMNGGPDYAKMFITQDKLCETTRWHKRTNPANPVTDPYFPINQSSLTLTPNGSSIHVQLKTLTPNFKTYLAKIDNGDWKPVQDTFDWTLHPNANHLEVKTLNQFAVEGPASTAEVELKAH